MDALTEALLMFAARREHLVQVIEPALARGDVVLCDRFTDATFAYQGGGRGFDWQVLTLLERMVQALPDGGLRQPDLTVWFDLDPQIAAQRLASARLPDKFESQPADFFAAVRAAYARRQQEMPGRFARIDAAQSIDAVGADVARVLDAWRHRGAA
jgi:dTMP kinase